MKLFPHKVLKVTESEDEWLCGARRKHWQGYLALHCQDQKGNALASTRRRASQGEKNNLFWTNVLQKWRLGAYPHFKQ